MARGGGRSFSGASRGRGRGRGRGRARGQIVRGSKILSRDAFTRSRVQEVEEASDDDSASESATASRDGSPVPGSPSDSEDETPFTQSYTGLLQILKANQRDYEPPRKKRKTESEAPKGERSLAEKEHQHYEGQNTADGMPEAKDDAEAVLTEAVEEENTNNIDEAINEVDSDEEDFILHDPFENHYCRIEEATMQAAMTAVKDKKRFFQNTRITGDMNKLATTYSTESRSNKLVKPLRDFHLKQRLVHTGAEVVNKLSADERDVATEILSYTDVQYGNRQFGNSVHLREVVSLHALNHVFKTRDRILKNNTKANQQADHDLVDLRDQGFTRPKVLFIVPTKQSCANFVESISHISQPDQQENKSRFLETFSSEDDDAWLNKPDDFRELFGGNHEEDFRVGLKFTRKTIKYFSGFYNSDIIFSSALGLMRTITTGGGSSKSKDEKKKAHDSDFLSSIEVVIVDNASAIQMQNWQHLDYVFSQLNLLPKDSHGCDFSRVRNWYLDGHAKYLRQTIIFSSHHTPEINSLVSQHTSNIQGIAKYSPIYKGAMLNLPLTLPITPVQTFLRIDSNNEIPTPADDAIHRFNYFTTAVLPQLLRSSLSSSSSTHKSSNNSNNNNKKGTLILIPSYADFTKLRNHLSTSASTASLSFGVISEYTTVRDVARARSHFITGRYSVLLYTERAHHHFRYKLKGVKRILFYGVPETPIFWSEVVGMLADSTFGDRPRSRHATHQGRDGNGNGHGNGHGNDDMLSSSAAAATASIASLKAKGVVRALFSKWDALKLERIVGSDRVGRLVGGGGKHNGSGGGGDVFEFV